MPIETEFKFQIARDQRDAVLKDFRRESAETIELESTYFDTDELDLKSRGLQLRLRRHDGRIIQTFKAKTDDAGPFGRAEHEVEVDGDNLNLDHVKDHLPGDLKREFSSWSLKKQFKTRFHRVRCEVSRGNFVAEECFDTGDILADSKKSEISEVEIELKAGSLSEYSSTCLEFLDRVPAGILLEGKAARGFRLARNSLPPAVFGNKDPLEGTQLLPEAVLLLLRRHFAHFLDNHPAVVSNGAPETIHQMRVGIRRFRATLQSFAPVLDISGASEVLGELRAAFSAMGPVREADVFLAENLPDLHAAGLSEEETALLEREIVKFRERRYGELVDLLRSASFARLMVRLNAWIEGSDWLAHSTPLDQLLTQRRVREFAAVRLRELQRKLFKKANKARKGELDDWHATRIAAKKLRYASSPLIRTFLDDDKAAQYEERLSELQDTLGALNDLNTISEFLSDVHKGVKGKDAVLFDRASAFCRGWSVGMSSTVIRDSDELLHAFSDFHKRLAEGGDSS